LKATVHHTSTPDQGCHSLCSIFSVISPDKSLRNLSLAQVLPKVKDKKPNVFFKKWKSGLELAVFW
jgi:hypothetical protein